MSLAPTDYDFGDASNYAFAMSITCANDEARKLFIEGFGHMLNYNHEFGIACYTKCLAADPKCAMGKYSIVLFVTFTMKTPTYALTKKNFYYFNNFHSLTLSLSHSTLGHCLRCLLELQLATRSWLRTRCHPGCCCTQRACQRT